MPGAQANSAPPVSIIVVTYECAYRLEALVASMPGRVPDDYELVVVDNASSDDPEPAARSWHGPVQYLRLAENVGFGRANNVALRLSRADCAILINPDTEVLDNGLVRIADLAMRKGALVGPAIVDGERRFAANVSGPEVGPWAWVRALTPARLQPGFVRRRTEPSKCPGPLAVSWLTGCCIVAPRKALLALGPFDPQIHMYGEDIDLGLRAGRAGISMIYAPALCTVLHHGGSSSLVRWGIGWVDEAVVGWRRAVRRAYGSRRERSGRRAVILNHRLRIVAKRSVGRNPSWNRLALAAVRRARPEPPLAPFSLDDTERDAAEILALSPAASGGVSRS